MAEGMIERHIENDNDVENDHPNDDDDDNNDRNTTATIKKKRPMLRFRNYIPLDNELLIKSQQQQGLLFVEDDDNITMNKSSSSNTNKRSKPNPSDNTIQTKSILELAFEKERLIQLQEENEYKTNNNNNKNHNNEQQPMMIENIISNHNHHKINWDLKRDIQQHINKLEKRTQKALLDILKHRITLSQQIQPQQHDLD